MPFRPGSGSLPASMRLGTTDLPMPDDYESPLEYGLRILNDPNVSPERRDRMCQCLLPYFHVNRNRNGKKADQADAANLASVVYPVRKPPTHPAMGREPSPHLDISRHASYP